MDEINRNMANKKEERNTLNGEEWRFLDFTDNAYSVSSYGRIYSHRYNRYLRLNKCHYGYVSVRILKKNYSVHRLVAYAFIGFDLLSKDVEINHKDGDKKNNTPSNLEIVTRKENMRHAIALGLHRYKQTRPIDPVRERLRHYITDVLNIRYVDFITKIGVSRGFLNNNNTVSDKTISKILSVYPIDENWLRYGKC